MTADSGASEHRPDHYDGLTCAECQQTWPCPDAPDSGASGNVRNPQRSAYVSSPAGCVHYADDPDTCTEFCTSPRPRTCPTRTPEVHNLGEFPMSCYYCHVEADS